MTPYQINLLQTLIFLLEKDSKLIIENNLLPYYNKAQELKEIMDKFTTKKWLLIYLNKENIKEYGNRKNNRIIKINSK